mgnify:CR=1 FL=1
MAKPSPREQLREYIQEKQATVGIVGLGYVGLPLIHAFVSAGCRCLGFDVDQNKVDQLNRGQSYIGHIPSTWLESWLANHQFSATSTPEDLANADAILMCVPTPLTEAREPDLSYVISSTQTISQILRPGQLIILESTTYPGTTRDVILPELEKTGLEVGKDFFLAYSPEREDPGNPDFSASGIPKVVGGYDPASCDLAALLYEPAVKQIIPVSSCEIAEACKILENTYRAVNIALVNELKVMYDRMGIDVWEVIDAAKTKPFGFSAFYPGPGLGGHCIPIDPFYLSWLARKHGMSTRFVELAGEINSAMPQYVMQRLALALNELSKPIRGSKVAILGIAYKPNVDDTRESPSFALMEELLKQGAEISYNDPYVARLPSSRSHNLPTMTSNELTPEYLASQDCVLISTNHSAYDYSSIVEHSSLVVDTRNATRDVTSGRDKIIKA